MKKIVFFYFLVITLIFSQEIPQKIKDILGKTESILKDKMIESRIESSYKMMGMTTLFDIRIITDLKTEKFYMEMGEMGITVYDGENLWTYNKMSNLYTKIPISKDELEKNKESFIPTSIKEISEFLPKLDSSSIEEVNFDDKKCYRIELTGKDKRNNNVKLTLFIDSSNYLPAQFEIESKFPSINEPIIIKNRIKTLKINPEVPSDIFVFKPPSGAKEFKFSDTRTSKEESLEGKKAPDFNLKDIEGKSITLSSYEGKVVLLNFWASWCPPCREELKVIQKIYNEYKDKGVIVLCVNSGEDKEKVEDFIDENNYKFPVLLDTDSKVSDNYKVNTIPRVLLINKDGIVVKDLTGYTSENEKILREEIEKIK
ncbi:MAG TPA: redoxin domain-containing protein [bacterium]|nr:redoxin domain-containing protein [bacterium]HOM27556.1 redoxin domain-containing protein [bacterium]